MKKTITAKIKLSIKTASGLSDKGMTRYWKAFAFLPDGRDFCETDFFEHYRTEKEALNALKESIKAIEALEPLSWVIEDSQA